MSDEGVRVKKNIVTIESDRCKGCELCILACPNECLYKSETMNQNGYNPAEWKYSGNKGDCTGCGACYNICPDTAISEIKKVKKDGKDVSEGQ